MKSCYSCFVNPIHYTTLCPLTRISPCFSSNESLRSCYVLPFSIVSLFLYARILIIIWQMNSSVSFHSFFYKQTRSQVSIVLVFNKKTQAFQAFLDIVFVVVYFSSEFPLVRKLSIHLSKFHRTGQIFGTY